VAKKRERRSVKKGDSKVSKKGDSKASKKKKRPAPSRLILDSPTSLSPVLTAISNLKSTIQSYDYTGNGAEIARQARALNLLGAAEQYLMDACDAAETPGYFQFVFEPPSE